MPARRPDPAAVRENVSAASLRFDDSGALAGAALARLAWRTARSGRTCDRCHEEKPLEAFSRDSRDPEGLRRYCRECAAKADRARRLTQSE